MLSNATTDVFAAVTTDDLYGPAIAAGSVSWTVKFKFVNGLAAELLDRVRLVGTRHAARGRTVDGSCRPP
jgi:hypothetical protein